MFNASARIHGLSQNAAFAWLSGLGLRGAGLRVAYFACNAGLSRCVLGTDRDDHTKAPPCAACVAQSQRIYQGSDTTWFEYQEDLDLRRQLLGRSLAELQNFEYQDQPLGQIVLPSLRWNLRKHNLEDNKAHRSLMREFISSAFRVAQEFETFLDAQQPDVVIVFNGQMFPEQMAKRAAQKRGIRVITHEVSFQPFSAFFTPGEATAYPIDIPESFELDEAQNAQLDEYLEKRFQGQFTMAGIEFWPEMRGLDEAFLQKAEAFKQIVPIFTNVIFDTSQVHANTLFADMFAWLDQLVPVIKSHLDTLFVIRAHPDEMRPGTKKQSRESVRDWVLQNKLDLQENVVFIDSGDYISSYALIRAAKFLIVYNSSIGLEGTLLNTPVLCGGKARYTQLPTVFFPPTAEEYLQLAAAFLAADDIEIPAEFIQHARRFLYYQNFKTGLSFADYLTPHPRKGFVRLKNFELADLAPENSPAIHTLLDGIVNQGDFLV